MARHETVTNIDVIRTVHYNSIVMASNTNPETKHTKYNIFL